MTTYPFHKHNTDRIIRIGTSGGWVKPSSGYAFKRILEKSEELVNQLLDGKKPNVESSPWHKWMDRTMLKAILYNYASGKDAFDSLFGKCSPAEVFQFLDEENTTLENLRIMSSSPIVPFTRAAFARPW
jgi:lycopene beta-cyclase